MNEKPVIFSGPMIRAIREDRKVQTRRVIKLPSWSTQRWEDFETDGETCEVISRVSGCNPDLPCPYGKPGARLWVRETFAWKLQEVDGAPVEPEEFLYSADRAPFIGRWIPSIHMPRRASRLTLEVCSVRVERLNDISEEDAIAEGIEPSPLGGPGFRDYELPANVLHSVPAIYSFQTLWDSINGKKLGCTWADSPWVWVIEFLRLDGQDVVRMNQ